jgi:hypothetical protein
MVCKLKYHFHIIYPFYLPPIQVSFRQIPDDLSYEEIAAMLPTGVSVEEAMAFAAMLPPSMSKLSIEDAMAMAANLSDEAIAAMLPPGMSIEDAMAIADIFPPGMSVEEAIAWSSDTVANAIASIPVNFNLNRIEESDIGDFNSNYFKIE